MEWNHLLVHIMYMYRCTIVIHGMVEPLGFLVNTDNIIGNHYEYRYHNFSNGLLLS